MDLSWLLVAAVVLGLTIALLLTFVGGYKLGEEAGEQHATIHRRLRP